MTRTSSAFAAALPASPCILEPLPRRGFLRQLAALPFIGGRVSLIGNPTAVAEPVSLDLMQAYKTWLNFEERSLAWEMAMHPKLVDYYGGRREDRFSYISRLTVFVGVGEAASWHTFDGSAPASERAALVLSTVGCDWREPEDRQ